MGREGARTSGFYSGRGGGDWKWGLEEVCLTETSGTYLDLHVGSMEGTIWTSQGDRWDGQRGGEGTLYSLLNCN
jgi:hypothetical protein